MRDANQQWRRLPVRRGFTAFSPALPHAWADRCQVAPASHDPSTQCSSQRLGVTRVVAARRPWAEPRRSKQGRTGTTSTKQFIRTASLFPPGLLPLSLYPLLPPSLLVAAAVPTGLSPRPRRPPNPAAIDDGDDADDGDDDDDHRDRRASLSPCPPLPIDRWTAKAWKLPRGGPFPTARATGAFSAPHVPPPQHALDEVARAAADPRRRRRDVDAYVGPFALVLSLFSCPLASPLPFLDWGRLLPLSHPPLAKSSGRRPRPLNPCGSPLTNPPTPRRFNSLRRPTSSYDLLYQFAAEDEMAFRSAPDRDRAPPLAADAAP